MFIVNGFGNWMARYIEKTILVLILYNLTSYAHSQPMKGAILIFFYFLWTVGVKCKLRMHSSQIEHE